MSLAGAIARKLIGRVRRARDARRGAPASGEAPPPSAAAASPAASAPEEAAAPPEEDLEVEAPVPGSLLLDIREPGELAYGVAEGAMLLPMDLVPHHLDELPRDRAITVYCAAGARSFGVAHWLREQGFAKAYSLAGGVGVFPSVGHAVAPPPGLMPGTRVKLPPDATAGGVPVGPGAVGEIIREVEDRVEVLVRDAQGFPVRVEAPTWAVGRG